MCFLAVYLVVMAMTFAAIPNVNAQSSGCDGGSILSQSLPNAGLEVKLGGNFTSTEEIDFTVCFLNSASGSIQRHIDYNFVIKDVGGREIFNAASATGQPILHTAEGVVTIPYSVSDEQLDSVVVTVAGINFTPIKLEDAVFYRIPEFPAGAVGGLVAVMTSLVIALTRYKSFRR